MTQVELLKQFKWENRIILLFAPSPDHEVYQEQLRALRAAEAGVLERDIKVFSVFRNEAKQGNEALTQREINQLRSAYETREDEFLFILLGKDGGVKRRSAELVSRSELFGQIDAMPMRQREMNRP